MVGGYEWEIAADKKTEAWALRLEDLATAADVEAAEAAAAELAEWTTKLKKTDKTSGVNLISPIRLAVAAFVEDGGRKQVADFLHSPDAEAKYDPVELWGVSEVSDFRELFHGCNCFNVDISTWRVDAVQTMQYMFSNCPAFDQPLGQWQVGEVQSMEGMSAGCSAFNQPLGQWQVGEVQNMEEIFYECSAFDQDLSQWAVGAETDTSKMFEQCLVNVVQSRRIQMVKRERPAFINVTKRVLFLLPSLLHPNALCEGQRGGTM